jgi:hypothetical protein
MVPSKGTIRIRASAGATDPTVRDKWQQVPKVATYPEVAARRRRHVRARQRQSWVGVEILVDPFTFASQAEIRVRSTLLADIAFRYPLAFCASSDSGAQ